MWIPFAFVLCCGAPYFLGVSAQNISNLDEEAEWINFGLSGRIVNGTIAELRQFPHQVSLRRSYNSRHFCGGSLIDAKHVITAAHCMFMQDSVIQAWTVMVVGGELQLSKDTANGQKRGVDKIYVHPGFSDSTLQNDVAVLVLKVGFTLNAHVNVVPLASSTAVPNTMCQVVGWGYPSEDVHHVTDDLMYVDVPLLSYSKCRDLLAEISDFPPGMLCAGYEEGQKDACQGDSGGGMICRGVLTGVISGGNGCARPRLPGVYSDVFFFKTWVTNIMNNPYHSAAMGQDK